MEMVEYINYHLVHWYGYLFHSCRAAKVGKMTYTANVHNVRLYLLNSGQNWVGFTLHHITIVWSKTNYITPCNGSRTENI